MTAAQTWPTIIQGGMGIAISGWRLAQAVASRGHLGVVSGTAIDRVLAARLEAGDAGGHLRRACAAFPDPELAQRVLGRYFDAAGSPSAPSRRPVPMHSERSSRAALELTVLGAFCEVWLAKDGHAGTVGINLLEKVQAPTLPTLYGALLAGVDYVLMGAGIPREIPGHLHQLRHHQQTILRLQLDDGSALPLPFDPSALVTHRLGSLPAPRFLAVVSSHVLAASLARSGGVDGFVVEGPEAGGHNAPPRGWSARSGLDPVYGPRDGADLERMRALGIPFWLAGGYAGPGAVAQARALGATGIQVGTAFAFCAESGMEPGLRRRTIAASRAGILLPFTDGRASPTGFPIKIVPLAGTEGGRPAALRRRRPCVLGYLRTPYRRTDGHVGWRCPAEPESDYLAKGGSEEDCRGRRCLCLGLLATAGHQVVSPSGEPELPLLTTGELQAVAELAQHGSDYGAQQVLERLLA